MDAGSKVQFCPAASNLYLFFAAPVSPTSRSSASSCLEAKSAASQRPVERAERECAAPGSLRSSPMQEVKPPLSKANGDACDWILVNPGAGVLAAALIQVSPAALV